MLGLFCISGCGWLSVLRRKAGCRIGHSHFKPPCCVSQVGVGTLGRPMEPGNWLVDLLREPLSLVDAGLRYQSSHHNHRFSELEILQQCHNSTGNNKHSGHICLTGVLFTVHCTQYHVPLTRCVHSASRLH